MNHVSVSPTNGNGPTQGQSKTLTRVGIEPTTFAHMVHMGTKLALHITLQSVKSVQI